jgi:hypothetical protein
MRLRRDELADHFRKREASARACGDLMQAIIRLRLTDDAVSSALRMLWKEIA